MQVCLDAESRFKECEAEVVESCSSDSSEDKTLDVVIPICTGASSNCTSGSSSPGFRGTITPTRRRLSSIARVGSEGHWLLLMLNVSATLLFLGSFHFVHDFCDEIYLAFVAALHLTLGVGVPLWAAQIGDSVPVKALLTYQAHYPTSRGRGLVTPSPGGILFWTRVLMPVCSLLGLAAPMLAIRHYVQKHKEVPNIDVGSRLMVMSMCCTSVWLFGKLLLSMAKIDYTMLHAAEIAINSLIDYLEEAADDEDSPLQARSHDVADIDWKGFAQRYRHLDALFEAVWSLRCVGGLFAFRACTLGFASIMYGALGMAFEDLNTQLIIGGTGVCFGIGCVRVIYTAARVTGRCRDKSFRSRSLMSAVTAFIGSTKRDVEQAGAFQNLLVYMQINPMGIKVTGVDITADFVFVNGIRLLAQAPTAFLFLGRYLQHS